MQHLWLIPALPLAGFLINGLLGRRMPKAFVHAVAVGAVLLSFAWVLKSVAASMPLESGHVERYFDWMRIGDFRVGFDFALDRLTAVMLLVVTGVGLLIHIYSIGYMAHEGGYYRFFAYLNLFTFFMLTLVLAANFLVMFVGWEGVGLCSYLLIGFWFHKRSATNAANKAFIVNRIGDFGFSLAIFLTVIAFGTADFGAVFAHVGGWPVETGVGTLTLIGLLLLVGAAGKSAQIPLYVWLPDAMEGPTPVSALIHAATMVTAGVYMIARTAPLYVHAPLAMDVVAAIGLATAVFAATIGMVQTDIKRVFAYSTVSQLGYMFLGVGTGAFGAGIFHLVTHAFFKALLFLGAGSVIHALSGEQDLRRMGGLRTKAPVTFWTMLAGAAAISALPFTSGFYSKDEILVSAFHRSPLLYWIGVVTAAMTAFYVFRAIFLAFFGTYRGEAHAHESPPVMTLPLVVLALLSLGGGAFQVSAWLEPVFPKLELTHNPALVFISVGAAIAGVVLAWVMYVWRPRLPDVVAARLGWLYTLVAHKYFVDEIYGAAVVRPAVQGSRAVLWRGVDQELIDGAVNGVAARARGIGGVLRLAQSGNIRSYAAWVLIGSVCALLALGVSGGLR
ncbi:MAG TPA: NADH-quinone oxidoreductase subunit L [Bryobacteraceae bacterium]